MTEIIGVSLLIFALIVGAAAYLAVSLVNYRDRIDKLRDTLDKKEAEIQRLRQENEWLAKLAKAPASRLNGAEDER